LRPSYQLNVALATFAAPPPIGDASHNISPRLFKQLVLKLNIGVEVLEFLQQLPSGIIGWQTLPLH
jgi:hypothetical protein